MSLEPPVVAELISLFERFDTSKECRIEIGAFVETFEGLVDHRADLERLVVHLTKKFEARLRLARLARVEMD